MAAALCFATAGFTTVAHAQPSVEGNTISWPDNAWYQVENRTTGEIVCQGGSQCTVADGIYWVSWFFPDGGGEATRVVVGNPEANNITTADFYDYLSIEGNTITWTVGGWYQVQDANTLTDICNGEGSCTVPSNGVYIVINHSLGLRATVYVEGASSTVDSGGGTDGGFTEEVFVTHGGDVGCGIVDGGFADGGFADGGTEVGVFEYDVIGCDSTEVYECVDIDGEHICTDGNGDGGVFHGESEVVYSVTDPRAATLEPIVTGNVISWADNGFAWYQVENRITGEIVCAGGSSCTLPDGEYWVSWFYKQDNGLDAGGSTSVVLGNPDTNNITRENFADYLMINGKTITWSVGGWYQVQNAQTLESLCNGEDSCTVPSAGQYIVINHSLGMRTTVAVN